MHNIIGRRDLLVSSLALAGGVLLGSEAEGAAPKQKAMKKVVVWSEGSAPKSVYPNDVNGAIAEGLKPLKGWEILTANLSDSDQGLPDSLLNETTVLLWWGHIHHGDVKDELVDRIVKRVKEDGMGFIATHSAHWSKPFTRLMGTSGSWKNGYVEDGSKVDIIVKAPKHPIAKGIKDFVIPHTERYSEPWEVPDPETLIFDGLYTRPSGVTEPSRQGMTWTMGKGRIFYFQPGHESYPIYFQDEVRQVFRNGVQWVAAKR